MKYTRRVGRARCTILKYEIQNKRLDLYELFELYDFFLITISWNFFTIFNYKK